ncbi:Origin recognition complex, subunit 1 like protein, partial [Aduncisulcus paluster]
HFVREERGEEREKGVENEKRIEQFGKNRTIGKRRTYDDSLDSLDSLDSEKSDLIDIFQRIQTGNVSTFSEETISILETQFPSFKDLRKLIPKPSKVSGRVPSMLQPVDMIHACKEVLSMPSSTILSHMSQSLIRVLCAVCVGDEERNLRQKEREEERERLRRERLLQKAIREGQGMAVVIGDAQQISEQIEEEEEEEMRRMKRDDEEQAAFSWISVNEVHKKCNSSSLLFTSIPIHLQTPLMGVLLRPKTMMPYYLCIQHLQSLHRQGYVKIRGYPMFKILPKTLVRCKVSVDMVKLMVEERK